jgi:hypothetical protein
MLQLLYTESDAPEWLFQQENATLLDPDRGTPIGEPL